MIHCAVTIMPTVHNVVVDPNEKENEICQFASDIKAAKTPIPVIHVLQAFEEMKQACIHKMRQHGLIAD